MSDCTCIRGDDGQVRVPRSRCPQHGWADTTPAPTLTDEQIDELTETVRADFVASAADEDEIRADHETFARWYAAVVAKAKREERERIAGRLESWAEDHKKSGNTEHFAALHFASFMVHHDETNWPSTGATR